MDRKIPPVCTPETEDIKSNLAPGVTLQVIQLIIFLELKLSHA
jgi:hypothetical protein